jgi:DnaJ-class molecular chaperone
MGRARDFYAVLGVPRDAATATIRRAYKRLVQGLYPARTGEDGREALREVQAAYETLADAERRRGYDASRTSAEVDTLGPRVSAGRPAFSRRSGASACVAELLLTRREASRGGLFPLRVPVHFCCPACSGTGGFATACETCDGDGSLFRRVPCDLMLPPGVRDGAVFQVRLQQPVPMTLLLSVAVLAH